MEDGITNMGKDLPGLEKSGKIRLTQRDLDDWSAGFVSPHWEDRGISEEEFKVIIETNNYELI